MTTASEGRGGQAAGLEWPGLPTPSQWLQLRQALQSSLHLHALPCLVPMSLKLTKWLPVVGGVFVDGRHAARNVMELPEQTGT